MKNLTWDDLAVLYKKETGRSAKILPMDQVFNWAAKQKDKFQVNKDGTLCLKGASHESS